MSTSKLLGFFSIALAATCGALPCAAQTATSAHTSAADLMTRARKGGDVWIVAPSGGDFTQITAAVAAAADGDTLLVRTGTYVAPTVDDKGLNIVEDSSATAQINGGFFIQNLAAGKALVISGFKTSFQTVLEDNQGAVRIESCELRGKPALSIDNCSDVVISQSTITGFNGISDIIEADHGGIGVDVLSSSVISSVYESLVTGGNGGTWFGGPVNGNGGHGYRQTAGFLFAAGSRFKGGKGAEADDGCFIANGGHGGHGMISPADSHGMDNLFIAGNGGPACGQGHGGGTGLPGSMTETLAGLTQLTTLANPVRDQSLVPVLFEGEAGSTVFLVVSQRPNHAYDASLHGVLCVQAPYLVILEMGTINSSGVLASSFFVPDTWAPDGTATRWFTQAVFQSSGGNVTLSNPTSLVVLDHMF